MVDSLILIARNFLGLKSRRWGTGLKKIRCVFRDGREMCHQIHFTTCCKYFIESASEPIARSLAESTPN